MLLARGMGGWSSPPCAISTRATPWELKSSPSWWRRAGKNGGAPGVADRVRFIQGDLFTNDFSQAVVVSLYLGHGANLGLRARLVRGLKPGAGWCRTHSCMGEWTADKLFDVRKVYLDVYSERFNEFRTNPTVPDFRNSGWPDHDVLSEWIVAAPVAMEFSMEFPLH
jgi:hypothetical protein